MEEKNIVLVSLSDDQVPYDIAEDYKNLYLQLFTLLNDHGYLVQDWILELREAGDNYIIWQPTETAKKIFCPIIVMPLTSMLLEDRDDIIDDFLDYQPVRLFLISELETDLPPFITINQDISQIPFGSLGELLLILEEIS